ncbi:AzlD domain-containing protein [Corynebacterium sp. HMSC28B08]|uniref:AzlD domain-containing protein n=1 Tax=Corynebacterium sp. HMSC28B08 TaxID=1581066 RepID=UPI0008A623F0|nr:AzlD domain-containing protein [Corynebacterium sp. HMSC28B08]OFT89989.1 hypothetical protein HMPREF3098_03925 [Corynebacterium sp. HMSC28B08]
MVASILIAALLTFLLRYIPVKLSSRISPDGTMAQVAAHMPLGIMVILVVYTFLGAESSQQAMRLGIGAVVALLLEIRYGNTLLSFVAGMVAFSVTVFWI